MFDTLKRAWQGANEDYAGLVAAGISYYAFLAMVPMLAVIALLYGLVADAETVARDIDLVGRALPPSAADLVGDQLRSVTETNDEVKGLGLLLAFAFALFGARNAAGALCNLLHNPANRDAVREAGAIAPPVALLAGGAMAWLVSTFRINRDKVDALRTAPAEGTA